MKFNTHSTLEGRHSSLSASKYHWIRYSNEKFIESFHKAEAARLGVRLHAFADEAIKMGIKLENNSKTLNRYINDCIGYRMSTEVVLRYSDNAFSTADALDFTKNPHSDRMILRCFDLKNGVSPASGDQLLVYAAYFCLEYGVRPMEIDYDLRIYQNDDFVEIEVNAEDILYIMDRIVEFDALISEIRGG